MQHAIVTPFTPRQAEEAQRQMRHSVYLDTLAECLYETAVLCDRLGDRPLTWGALPQSDKARYRFEAEGAMNRLDLAKRYEAQLRAREHVATAHFDKDYSRLPSPVQARIKRIVQTAVETYSRVLEGVFTPLPTFRAVELEPVEGDQ